MKIVFTGGTGGHFYPLIAIAEAVRDISAEQRILTPRMYYIADAPFDEDALYTNGIQFIKVPAGKLRRYFSLKNVSDVFKTLGGVIRAYFTLLKLFPDVVVSKGGYASVPTVIAASLLRIPIIVHESDAKPGRATLVGAKRASRIAVAFESAIPYFPKGTKAPIAKTGIPVRKALLSLPDRASSMAALGLDTALPTVLIIGGSAGSVRINDTVLGALPQLIPMANVIHQTGKAHFTETARTGSTIAGQAGNRERYHAYPYLNATQLRQAAASADVIISRAGTGAITEIALWGIPAILIPIPESISHDQRTNAYAYARTGAATVLEEANLTKNVLASEARRLMTDRAVAERMRQAAAGFANPHAARIVAEEAIRFALSHEQKNG